MMSVKKDFHLWVSIFECERIPPRVLHRILIVGSLSSGTYTFLMAWLLHRAWINDCSKTQVFPILCIDMNRPRFQKLLYVFSHLIYLLFNFVTYLHMFGGNGGSLKNLPYLFVFCHDIYKKDLNSLVYKDEQNIFEMYL